MTNLDLLPLRTVKMEVGTNEFWLDSFGFDQPAQAAGIPSTENKGNGNIFGATVMPGAPIGNSLLQITSVEGDYVVFDPEGNIVNFGSLGFQFSTGGISFSLTQGSMPFAVGDVISIFVNTKPIELTDIDFVLCVRESPDNPKPVLAATTADYLAKDDVGGVVGLDIPDTMMADVVPGLYLLDMIAVERGGRVKRVVTGTVDVVRGNAFKTMLPEVV